MEQVLYSLPDGWKKVCVDDICTKITDGAHKTPKYTDDGVPFLSVKDVNKGLIDFSNTRFVSQETHDDLYKRCNPERNDILYTKVGSTGVAKVVDTDREFSLFVSVALLKPKSELIDSKYFEYALNSPESYTQAQSLTRGVANRNLVLKDIKSITFNLAPFKEQKRIVEKLDALLTRIDTAIEHLQESVVLADALYASELNSVFSSGNDKWPLRELNEVAEVARGKSKHRPRNDKSLFGGEYPFIQTGDVRNAQKYITTFSATYNEKGLQQSKLWPKDTICLTIAANIGDVAILGMEACFPDSVVGISSSELQTDYLYYFLTTLQQQLDSKANAAAQKNINLKILSEIKIPVPSPEDQNNIVRQINEIDRLAVKVKAEISEKIANMQQLKASILDSAFKGGL